MKFWYWACASSLAVRGSQNRVSAPVRCWFFPVEALIDNSGSVATTRLNSSLLTISVIAVLLPAAFRSVLGSTDINEGTEILSLSRGVSVHPMPVIVPTDASLGRSRLAVQCAPCFSALIFCN
jgi:hypothetical protein